MQEPSDKEKAIPATMRAIIGDRYGGPETLQLDQIDTPSPGADEVLIDVAAAGVDRGVWHLMRGEPLLVRAGFGLRRPRTPTPGFDLAGTIVTTGSKVTEFSVGDHVFGIGKATFADYAVAKAAKLVTKPDNLSWEAAGAATVSGITAIEGLRNNGRIAAGQRVLVLGASGGVGSFASQIACADGAEVVGVASAAKADFVRSLGAKECLDYKAGPLVDIAGPQGPFDLIFAAGGLTSTRDLRSLLTERGSLVLVGGEGGGKVTGGFGQSIRAGLLSPFVKHHMPFFLSQEKREFIEPLRDLLADGSISVALDQTYDLADASQALAALESGTVCGKLALRIA